MKIAVPKLAGSIKELIGDINIVGREKSAICIGMIDGVHLELVARTNEGADHDGAAPYVEGGKHLSVME